MCWDGETYSPNEIGNILKWIITGSTVILVFQIVGPCAPHRPHCAPHMLAHTWHAVRRCVERKKFQSEIRMREKTGGKLSGHDHPSVTYADVLSLSADEFRLKTWLQVLVCAFHPLPSIQLVGYEYFPDEVRLLPPTALRCTRQAADEVPAARSVC